MPNLTRVKAWVVSELKLMTSSIYVTVVTVVRDVENYVTVVLSWIRLSVTFEDLFHLH